MESQANMKKSLSYFFSKEKFLKEKGERILGFTLISPTFPPPIKKKNVLKFLPFSFQYSPSGGDFQLREILAKFYSQKNKISLKKENVFVGNGGKEVLYILLRVLLKKGEEVILSSPYWPSYLRMIKMTGGKPKIIKSLEKTGFYPDVKKIAKEITNKTKLIIINSPCNPTGRILKKDDLKFLAELSLKKDIFLVSDEVYEIYDFENCFFSLLKFFHKNVFCVFSASKIFSMCGWRVGWGIGDKNLINEMIEYQANLSTSPHTLSQLIVRELFKDKEKILNYFSKIKIEAKKRRDLAISLLRKKKVEFIFPEGGIAMFIKIPPSFKDSFSFAQKLLEKEKVSVAPGEIFGEKKYFRINLALPIKDIKEGVKRIIKYY